MIEEGGKERNNFGKEWMLKSQPFEIGAESEGS
jgi:hypothetical protein